MSGSQAYASIGRALLGCHIDIAQETLVIVGLSIAYVRRLAYLILRFVMGGSMLGGLVLIGVVSRPLQLRPRPSLAPLNLNERKNAIPSLTDKVDVRLPEMITIKPVCLGRSESRRPSHCSSSFS